MACSSSTFGEGDRTLFQIVALSLSVSVSASLLAAVVGLRWVRF